MVIFNIFITSCNTVRHMNNITQISYTSDSGPVLPELQWYEQIVITKNQVSLTRNGKVENSEINAGSWNFAVDEQKVTALFEQLEGVDCSTIKRVEPDVSPDGGHTESYTIVYSNNETCSLIYDPGTTYTNGNLLVSPIKIFMHNISFPAEASSRYQVASP